MSNYFITEKLTCACGATFEAASHNGNGQWVATEALNWSENHKHCPKLYTAKPATEAQSAPSEEKA